MREKPLLLIVDDEKDFLEIMTAKFQSAGFEVAVARNGAEAVKSAKELLPDLVLMDIHMPNETGTDVALTIKQDPATKNMKIAFLTSLKDPWPAMTGEREKIARELGMDDFLEKGEDLETLVRKVQEILGR